MGILFPWLAQLFFRLITYLEQAFLHLTRPVHHSIILSTAADLTRTKSDLIAENALLRQQLVVLYRQVNKPRFTQSDRLWFVLLVSRVKHWKASLLIFKPDTLLGWHRQGFRLLWKFKSRNRGGRPKLATETISLIQAMAKENALWGAERIHGELLKLNIQVATTTIKKYLRQFRANHSPSQTWSVFLKNHAPNVWACDFLPVIDLFFRQVYLFFIVELGSRRVVHFNICHSSGYTVPHVGTQSRPLIFTQSVPRGCLSLWLHSGTLPAHRKRGRTHEKKMETLHHGYTNFVRAGAC